MRFNVPPGWPTPPDGWSPGPGWRPDPSWPPAPENWQWWVRTEAPAAPVSGRFYGYAPPPSATPSAPGTPDPATQAGPHTAVPLGARIDEQLFKLARWSRLRNEQRSGDLPTATLGGSDPAAAWFNVVSAVAKCSAVRTALPGAEHVLPMIKALYDIEDEQAKLLNGIDSNVKLLKEGPYRAGRLLLGEAERVGSRDEEYRKLLESAKDRFYDAQPLASSVQERALVELHLGLVWLSLGHHTSAQYWLEQSYQSARLVVDALTKQAGDVKVLKTKWAATALSIYYPAGLFVLPVKLRRVWNADQSRNALADFLPFVNTIASCLNQLGDGPVVPTLQLALSASGGPLLEETGVRE